MNRTDLALEIAVKKEVKNGITLEKIKINGLPLTKITVTEEGTEQLGKPAGEYMTLFCADRNEETEINALSEILSELINKNISEKGRILVAGLGNENITPDSLGVRAVSRVAATAQFAGTNEFNELGMREVAVIETGVLAQTGIESAEQLKYIAGGFKPDLILAVDSLACCETERLARTIQVTDTGIAPGSGVKNSRREISKRIFGVPVLAVGVPTVIDLESLTDSKKLNDAHAMVVPRDIDITVNHFAKVISKAINRAVNPSLSPNEIERLLF